jgi:multiple sugar transport system permease protein
MPLFVQVACYYQSVKGGQNMFISKPEKNVKLGKVSSDQKRSIIGIFTKNGRGSSLFFFLPSLILLVLFFVGPVLLTFYFAFTNLSLTGVHAQDPDVIWFGNFSTMFQDPTFTISVINTIVFLFFTAIIGQQGVGLILALLMREKSRLVRRVVGTLVIAGWVTPEIVVAIIFVAFFSDQGTANAILGVFGIEGISWLYSYPMITVIIAGIWHGTAFSMLVYQAALGDIPKEIEEASKVDGANAWQRLWKIILPTIKGSIVTNMVLITLQTLGVFTLIFAMTGGGPGNQTMTLPIFMYKAAFSNFQLGYATAISLVLLLIGIITSLIYMRTLKVKL